MRNYKWPNMYFVPLFCQIVTVLGTQSGPYKASFTKVGPCASPTPPIDKKSGSYYYAELYNSSSEINLLRGNITVARNIRVKKVKGKSYLWESNKWKVNYQINNMACNSAYFPALVKTTGLKYDAKTCTFTQGTYIFSNVNIDRLRHAWTSVEKYGKVLFRLESFSSAGTIFCYEYETLVEPINK